jgi:hypothetical protein
MRNVRVIITADNKSIWEDDEIKISPFLGRISKDRNVIHKKDNVLEFHIDFRLDENIEIITIRGRIKRKITWSLNSSLN